MEYSPSENKVARFTCPRSLSHKGKVASKGVFQAVPQEYMK